jgi:hypothetical protein
MTAFALASALIIPLLLTVDHTSASSKDKQSVISSQSNIFLPMQRELLLGQWFDKMLENVTILFTIL